MIDKSLTEFIRDNNFGTQTQYFTSLKTACDENKKHEEYVQSILAASDYGTLNTYHMYEHNSCQFPQRSLCK